jgi:hypothetical protein
MKRNLFSFVFLLISLLSFSTMAKAQGNAANPFDRVGAAHNEGLAKFFNNYSLDRVKAEQMDEKGLYEFICTATANQNCDAAHQVRTHELTQATKKMSLKEAADYLQAKGLVSAAYVQYVNKVDGAVAQLAAGGYNQLYRTLVGLEAAITADAGLKKSEQENLLKATSVARHSSKFWNDLRTGETSYTGLANVSIAADIIDDIIAADIIGAIVGDWVAWLLGLGLWDSIKVTIASAIAFSAAELASIIWDWIFG